MNIHTHSHKDSFTFIYSSIHTCSQSFSHPLRFTIYQTLPSTFPLSACLSLSLSPLPYSLVYPCFISHTYSLLNTYLYFLPFALFLIYPFSACTLFLLHSHTLQTYFHSLTPTLIHLTLSLKYCFTHPTLIYNLLLSYTFHIYTGATYRGWFSYFYINVLWNS